MDRGQVFAISILGLVVPCNSDAMESQGRPRIANTFQRPVELRGEHAVRQRSRAIRVQEHVIERASPALEETHESPKPGEDAE